MSVKVELEGTESFQPLKALQKMRSRILIQNPTKMQSRQKVIKTFSFPQTNFYGEKVDVIHHSNPKAAVLELQKCDSNPFNLISREQNSPVSIILHKITSGPLDLLFTNCLGFHKRKI